MNLSKSTYKPGPAPKSAINMFEPWEDGMKGTIDPIADAVSVKRIKERQTDIVWKKGGRVMMTGQSVISADRRTTTVTQTGTDPQGRAVNNVIVSDKQ